MKKLLILIVLLFSFSSFAKSKWQKHYDLVNNDIKTVEALKTKDLQLRVRLFELYGEKLTLLLEKENEYRIKYIETGSKKGLTNVLNLQRKVLRQIEAIARKIENQTKSKRILTKVYYYRALNFYLVKKYKLFYKYIKQAERINRDKSIAYVINTKLADYHYNEKQYAPAIKYYKRLITKKDNKWLTKIYYNLAWSQLKLDQFKPALRNLKIAHKLSKRKGYFQIGDQLEDSVLLFYAYSRKTKEGLNYIIKHRINSFDQMLKYLHYVFENGNKRSSYIIIAHFKKMKLNINQEYQLLAKKVLIHRTLKQFSLLQREFMKFKKKMKVLRKFKPKEEHKSELINAIRSYTGYLQELVKSRGLINKKQKNKYVQYVAYNFNVLKAVDIQNALEYNYYEGETYFLMGNYKRAAFVYAGGINKYKKMKKKKSKKYLNMSFDSLFKSLEKIKNPPSKILLFSYNSYLHFYPKGPKSAQVYQRLINFYRLKNNEKMMFSTLRKYNKYYPQDIKKQRAFYKDILNKYIKKEDIPSLLSLKRMVEKKFLRFTKSEIVKLDKIINQIHFSKYEAMAKKGKVKEALAGFWGLYENKKNEYNIRFNALLKKLYYEDRAFNFEELAKTYMIAMNFLRKKEKNVHKEELYYYAQNICVSDLHEKCLVVTNRIKKDKHLKITKALDNLSFKVYTIYNNVNDKIFLKANNFDRKNYLFKFLLVQDPGFTNKLYKDLYKQKKFRDVISPSIDQRFWRTYYRTLDLGKVKDYISKISIPQLKSQYLGFISGFKSNLATSKFVLPSPPKVKDIKFEQFGQYNTALENRFVANVNSVNNSISKIHPNFLPKYLSQLVKNFEKESLKVKNYIPVSKDPELEKAISNRVLELSKILDLKLIEYRSLYIQSIEKSQLGIGSGRYIRDIISEPENYKFRGIRPWQN